MGNVLNYKEEIRKAMKMLAADDRVIFIGQNVIYSGAVAIHLTLVDIPEEKKFELPVAEDMQMGLSIGLSLEGYIPVSIFPRMDFLIVAANQLVNHLDKIEEMSSGRFKPKIIIRTGIGGTKPLNPGLQHCQDHTTALECLLTNVDVVKLVNPEAIVPSYQRALESERSTILVEYS
ncbi:MAG TPA: hypothetical protein VJ377_06815 [Dehalococcoidales bacterium]|nr:hypothetical protein [Dehalococcoidales bacterium]